MVFRLRFAFLLLLITGFTTQAINRGYSQSSKRSIYRSTVFGALSGVLDGVFIAYLDGMSDWKMLKKYRGLLITATVVGAFIGYGISTVMTPEWDFGVVENDIKTITESDYLKILAVIPNDNFICDLKKIEISKMFPLYAGYLKYSYYLNTVQADKKKLISVLNSNVETLYAPSEQMFKELEEIEFKLTYALALIKTDESFSQECVGAAYVKACNTLAYY
jgi:hypothetical protein